MRVKVSRPDPTFDDWRHKLHFDQIGVIVRNIDPKKGLVLVQFAGGHRVPYYMEELSRA